MESKIKKPATVRLSNQQYEEMKSLGFTNESTYVKYKMEQGALKLEGLKNPSMNNATKDTEATSNSNSVVVEDQLTIQRLSMENNKLLEKLEDLNRHNEDTLNGVSHKVHSMLQEELQKRDFETLKKSEQKNEKQIETLAEEVVKVTKERDAKQEEIEALVKKLGLVELGKALLPSAISGLAKQYPTQMKGIAGTLGKLGVTDEIAHATNTGQDEQLSHICNYLQEVCTPAQFQEIMELLFQLAEQLKDDGEVLQKVRYYIQQLYQKRNQTNEDTAS